MSSCRSYLFILGKGMVSKLLWNTFLKLVFARGLEVPCPFQYIDKIKNTTSQIVLFGQFYSQIPAKNEIYWRKKVCWVCVYLGYARLLSQVPMWWWLINLAFPDHPKFLASADFWMNLQLRWDLYFVQQLESTALKTIKPIPIQQDTIQ